MKLLSLSALSLGLLLLFVSVPASLRENDRDIPNDGLNASGSLTSFALGFDRDVVCVWGDDGERSTEECHTCDDGRYHPHWTCDPSNVLLRPSVGREPLEEYKSLALAVGPGSELLVALGLCAIGGLGLYMVRDRR